MNIENCLLSKAEIPISHEVCFKVPIHPSLLHLKSRIEKTLAAQVFAETAISWYKDLTNYIKSLPEENQKEKEWIENVFLSSSPELFTFQDVQTLKIGWEDNTLTSENGFAYLLSISRNSGGSLYFNEKDGSCTEFLLPGRSKYLRFSEEKANSFAINPQDPQPLHKCYIYAHHNVEYFPGALFLRNWAVLYLNAAIISLNLKAHQKYYKQIFP